MVAFNKNISSLKDQEHKIKHCSTELENITKFASDLQTFLGMREIQSKVTDNECRLKSMIANKSLENVDIQLIINDKVQGLLASEKFGSITIKQSPSPCTNIHSKKIRQAQISAPNIMQPISNFSVNLKQKFDTPFEWPTGCSMTRTGTRDYLFTDYDATDLKLVSLNAEGGTVDISIPSTLRKAFDVECFNENKVAVTTGNPVEMIKVGYEVDVGIYIVDLTKRQATHFIDLPGYPYGITFNGTSLICCVQYKDIHVISCKDYSITTIPNTVTTESSYVSTHDDKIFYTYPEENKVSCCFFDGTPALAFQDETNLEYPRGITVDKQGNVFVVGLGSCNVLVLSSDGKHC
ncbi:unnamed protein product [Mytilus coruscus]|uniref:TRIM2_3 n=1 Tax=Mytilus coruscus TaxID=42192 RepID=A0A6J8CXM2_MYTCO|nr:unnamed protein product [Mytilus coruscus]